MKQLLNTIFILFFTLLVISACDDTKITDIEIPDMDVSFPQHIQPIFNQSCNNTACHNSEDRAGGISLTSYGELFSSPFLVIPFAPDESLLYLSVSGKSVNVMPPPYGTSLPLTDNQIRGIKTWIEEGAESD